MNTTANPVAPAGKNQAEPFLACLKALELHLQEVSGDLISGDALSFEGRCAQLPRLLAEFSAAYQSLPPALAQHRAIKLRMRSVRDMIGIQRESMAKRANLVERELKVFLPTQGSATYGRGAGGYAQGGRTAGSLTSMHA